MPKTVDEALDLFVAYLDGYTDPDADEERRARANEAVADIREAFAVRAEVEAMSRTDADPIEACGLDEEVLAGVQRHTARIILMRSHRKLKEEADANADEC